MSDKTELLRIIIEDLTKGAMCFNSILTQRPNRPEGEAMTSPPRFKADGQESLLKIGSAWAERIVFSLMATRNSASVRNDLTHRSLAEAGCLIAKCCFEEAGSQTAAAVIELIANDCRLAFRIESEKFRQIVAGYCEWFSGLKETEERRRCVDDLTAALMQHCPFPHDQGEDEAAP